MKKSQFIMIALVMVSLAACGTTTPERAVSGAGIGAATGAVGAVVLGANPVAGAVVGGVVGGATGALTTKKQIDLDH